MNRDPFGTNATLDEHVKVLAKFVEDLIQSIEVDENDSSNMLKKVGQQHAILHQRAGFTAEIWLETIHLLC